MISWGETDVLELARIVVAPQSWTAANYRNTAIMENMLKLWDFMNLWQVSGCTSSKGHKYDLIVKFNLFIKHFMNPSATFTNILVVKTLYSSHDS